MAKENTTAAAKMEMDVTTAAEMEMDVTTAAEADDAIAAAETAAAETAEASARMTPEEKAARKAERKAAKKAAAVVVREFLGSPEGKGWAAAAGEFGKALLTLFPGRVTAAVKEASGPREVARCVTVCNYIAEHGTVTDLEMFQQFKVGVAETRKFIRNFTQKAERTGTQLEFFIRRTEDGEGWEALPASTPSDPVAE